MTSDGATTTFNRAVAAAALLAWSVWTARAEPHAHRSQLPVVLSAGAYSFSDELGGFRLTGISGSGTRDDPILLDEDLHVALPVHLVIRRVRSGGALPGAGRADALTLVKRVRNASGHVWVGFDLELQEIFGEPSTFGDGLSFNQISAHEEDVASEVFGAHERIFEPVDRIRFFDGHIDPGETVSFRMLITDPTSTAVFYLVQEPKILLSRRKLPDGPLQHADAPGRGEPFVAGRRHRTVGTQEESDG